MPPESLQEQGHDRRAAKGSQSARQRAARRGRDAHTRPRGGPIPRFLPRKPSHSFSGVSPTCSRNRSICSAVRSAEWFAGRPAISSPYPLIVYAKTTVGRSVVSRARRNASSTSTRSCPPRFRTRALGPSGSAASKRETRLRSLLPNGSNKTSSTTPSVTPKRDWYCSLGISSRRQRSRSPPSRANVSRRRLPYLSWRTSHPLARNFSSSSPVRLPGMTRSSD